MRTTATILTLAVAIALTGCSKEKEAPAGEKSSGTGDVTAATIGLKPGQYEATVEMLELSIPGMPAGMGKEMAKRASAPKVTYCVTAKDAAQSVKDMIGKAQTGTCEFKKYDISGGHIATEMACKNPTGSDGTIKTEGTITSDGMETTGEIDFPEMKAKTRSTFKRVGDCPA
jgi:hypothetical protein